MTFFGSQSYRLRRSPCVLKSSATFSLHDPLQAMWAYDNIKHILCLSLKRSTISSEITKDRAVEYLHSFRNNEFPLLSLEYGIAGGRCWKQNVKLFLRGLGQKDNAAATQPVLLWMSWIFCFCFFLRKTNILLHTDIVQGKI